jgi:hypothetical protein
MKPSPSGRFPCWSRDGHWIALIDADGEVGNEVFSMAVGGGERRALGEGFMPSWSPTDDRLLFTRLDQREQHIYPIVTVRPDGSDERVLTQNGWAGRWSPDGSRVAFLRFSASPSSGELIVVNADGSGERSLGELVERVHNSKSHRDAAPQAARTWNITCDRNRKLEWSDSRSFKKSLARFAHHRREASGATSNNGHVVVKLKRNAEAVETRTQIGRAGRDANSDGGLHEWKIRGTR